jgi:2-polyprenyl-6-methoxyphenol hydroxylase-like FAD-dependent oxidoreductase
VFEGPLSPDSPHADTDHRTTIEATSSGWFYSALLSLTPRTRIVAFHTLPTHPSAKHARRREGFLDLLHASSFHISTIILTNNYEIAPGGFPRCTAAGSSYLDKPCSEGDRWFAVGDAAMAFDPLSSQGIMTALEMGYYIGMVLAGLVRGDRQEDVNSRVGDMYRRVREEYEQHRTYYYGLVKRFHDESFWNTVVNHIQDSE